MIRTSVAAVALLPLLACRDQFPDGGPHAGVTLLVTNATCRIGQCAPVQILGFPSDHPLTPGGLWSIDLGVLNAPSACLTFPPSATFRVIGVSNDGTADTTTFTWTTDKALALGGQSPTASLIQASPSTNAFVPASGSGWTVTLPGGSRVSPTRACTL